MTIATERKMTLAAARGLDLRWERPRFGWRELTLRAGDQVIATLSISVGRKSPARGSFADREWVIERRGPLGSMVVVREPDQDADVAVLEMSLWGGGLLDFARAGQFRWRRAGFGPRRMFATFGGDALVRFSHRISLRRRVIEVEVEPAAWALHELPVLLLLGGYLMRHPAHAS